MLCVQLDENLEKKLDALCRAANRSREDIVRELVEEYLLEEEDVLIAESRLLDAGDAVIRIDEMRRRLGLDA